MVTYDSHIIVWREIGSILVLLAAGIALILIAPGSRLPYIAGCALLFAGIASLIDLIQAPGEPPNQQAIAIVAAAGVLVGGW